MTSFKMSFNPIFLASSLEAFTQPLMVRYNNVWFWSYGVARLWIVACCLSFSSGLVTGSSTWFCWVPSLDICIFLGIWIDVFLLSATDQSLGILLWPCDTGCLSCCTLMLLHNGYPSVNTGLFVSFQEKWLINICKSQHQGLKISLLKHLKGIQGLFCECYSLVPLTGTFPVRCSCNGCAIHANPLINHW